MFSTNFSLTSSRFALVCGSIGQATALLSKSANDDKAAGKKDEYKNNIPS
jgi:hypothetical protein